jgi:hypothetical protein
MQSTWADEKCPIEDNLITYLLASGITDIAWIILLMCASCVENEPTTRTTQTVTTTRTFGSLILKEEKQIQEDQGQF